MRVQALYDTDQAMSHPVVLHQRRVTGQVAERYRLDDGGLAAAATSCLLRPQPGDLVLVGDGGDRLYILHVLAREAGGTADIGVAGAQQLRISSRQLELNAGETMALRALKDMELQAVTGSLGLSARNLLLTAIDSLIEQVRHRIGSAQDICMRAKGLLTLRGGNSFITAERDVRIDGERINVG